MAGIVGSALMGSAVSEPLDVDRQAEGAPRDESGAGERRAKGRRLRTRMGQKLERPASACAAQAKVSEGPRAARATPTECHAPGLRAAGSSDTQLDEAAVAEKTSAADLSSSSSLGRAANIGPRKVRQQQKQQLEGQQCKPAPGHDMATSVNIESAQQKDQAKSHQIPNTKATSRLKREPTLGQANLKQQGSLPIPGMAPLGAVSPQRRSQSAMAGSLSRGQPSGGHQAALTSSSLELGTRYSNSNNNNHRPHNKVTRVRINSISEQIQDPNWLIRMSQEQEQRRKRSSHLRALHRRLKSTITGSTEPSGSSAAQQATAGPSADLSCEGAGQGSPLSVPQPAKVPVSILKQRNSSNPANGQAASAQLRAPANQRRKVVASPVQQVAQQPGQPVQQHQPNPTSQANQKPVASKSTKQTAPATPPTRGQATPTRPASAAAALPPSLAAASVGQPAVQMPVVWAPGAISQSGQPQSVPVAAASAASTVAAPLLASGSSTAPGGANEKPVPICADGQVKVSGWRRNNLLAKTLSHFDEIRGNQRPIFMPTKITLPTEAGGGVAGPRPASSPTHQTRSSSASLVQSGSSSSGGGGGSSARFAELVREVVSKRGNLAPSLGDDQRVAETTNTQRSASADPMAHHQAARLINQTGISLKTLASPSAGQNQQASPERHKQQVAMSRRHGSGQFAGQLATPELVSQLLSASSPGSGGAASSRQYKLQHKNQQLLQSLRNELQASLSASETQVDSGGSPGSMGSGRSPNGSGGRTKDWKRLATKLSLLTSPRAGHAHPGQGSPEPPKNPSGANATLRLTLSNREASKASAAQHSGSLTRLRHTASQLHANRTGVAAKSSSGLQVPGSNFGHILEAAVDLKMRKLSSSSMVAGGGGPSAAHEPQRRSSDSEAYRQQLAAAAAAAANLSQTSDSSTQQTQPPAPEAPGGGSGALVMNRDDLLQLLQVRCGSRSGSRASNDESSGSATDETNTAGLVARHANEPLRPRLSLQLPGPNLGPDLSLALHQRQEVRKSASGGSERNQVRPASEEPATSLSALTSESHPWPSIRDPTPTPALSPRPPSPPSEEKEFLVVEPPEVGVVPTTTVGVAEPTEGGVTAGSAQRPRADLSWVVKQTSKVALFQRRLLKLRWRLRKHGSPPTEPEVGVAVSGSAGEETSGQAAEVKEPDGDGGANSGSLTAGSTAGPDEREKRNETNANDVFMDPALIGDAIEIFLRSTMQAAGGNSATGELATEGTEATRNAEEQVAVGLREAPSGRTGEER